MGDAEAAVKAILKKHCVGARTTRDGILHRFDNGQTVLISAPKKGGRQPPWDRVLQDMRRVGLVLKSGKEESAPVTTTATAYEKARTQTESKPMPAQPAQPSNSRAPDKAHPLLITPTSSTQRLVVEESSHFIELRPDQVHALIRTAGVQVPDSATVSFTNTGYVRVSWTSRRESMES